MVPPHHYHAGTGFTPFCLLYGDEAMTPTEVKGCSLRVQFPQTDRERKLSLDLTKGTWLHAIQNLDHYIKKTKAGYDPRVAPRNFKPDELVLRRALTPKKLRNK